MVICVGYLISIPRIGKFDVEKVKNQIPKVKYVE